MNPKLRCMTSLFLTKGDRMLLLYRQGGRVVNNVWVGSAGGHFEKEELNAPETCVLRELKEELGLAADDISDLTMRYITIRKTNNEIRQNYYFFAKLKDNVPDELTSNEGQCRWFAYEELPDLEMPLSARIMMDHYLSVGMHNDKVYVGITGVGKNTTDDGIAGGRKGCFVELEET